MYIYVLFILKVIALRNDISGRNTRDIVAKSLIISYVCSVFCFYCFNCSFHTQLLKFLLMV